MSTVQRTGDGFKWAHRIVLQPMIHREACSTSTIGAGVNSVWAFLPAEVVGAVILMGRVKRSDDNFGDFNSLWSSKAVHQ
mmetsp:Transcript_14235/g.23694  ORF Transcript_14235/g.23694 Transcript_14235/m.23694 type:complete len:80 (-) Transcript_14235:888-1127(-)